MKSLIIRILVRLIPPEKVLQIVLWGVVGVLLILLMFFYAPIMAYKHIPFGQTPEHFNYYSDAVKVIERETDTDYQSGVKLNWQYIMAIDAVLLEQDFDRSNSERAIEMAWLFILEKEEKIKKTCMRTVKSEDENGNVIEKKESYDCSFYVTKYYEKSFDAVLDELVANGQLSYDQIEDVKRYTLFDLSQITEGVNLPPNWRPVIKDFAWPVPNVYKITSTFGIRNDPFHGTLSAHNGLDIGAPTGTDVVAIDSGVVIYAMARGTAGNAVIIKHDNDVQSRYYHLHKIYVTAGDLVFKGDQIGEVGNTGRSTGPHLHLEIHQGSRPIDPLTFYH